MSADGIQVACKNCVCFVALEQTKGEGGECRRNPPTAILMASRVVGIDGRARDDQRINSVFPPVPNNCFCMTFVPRAGLQESGVLVS